MTIIINDGYRIANNFSSNNVITLSNNTCDTYSFNIRNILIITYPKLVKKHLVILIVGGGYEITLLFEDKELALSFYSRVMYDLV